MGKSSTFVKAFKAHLEDNFLGNRVDSIVVTHLSIVEAIDAGIIKPTVSDQVQRVKRAILIRRASEDLSEIRAGDRRRLTSAGVFDVAVLVSSEFSDDGEAIVYEILDLVDEIQTSIEDAPVSASDSAYNVSLRSVVDAADTASKFFGSIVTVEASLVHV